VNKKGQVLVANRSQVRRMTLAALLAQHGYAVDEASTSEETQRLVRTKHFDCVLTEYRLPEVESHRLVVELRSENPGTQVIVFDALPDTPTYVRFMEEGVFDYLVAQEGAARLVEQTGRAVAMSQAGATATAPD